MRSISGDDPRVVWIVLAAGELLLRDSRRCFNRLFMAASRACIAVTMFDITARALERPARCSVSKRVAMPRFNRLQGGDIGDHAIVWSQSAPNRTLPLG